MSDTKPANDPVETHHDDQLREDRYESDQEEDDESGDEDSDEEKDDVEIAQVFAEELSDANLRAAHQALSGNAAVPVPTPAPRLSLSGVRPGVDHARSSLLPARPVAASRRESKIKPVLVVPSPVTNRPETTDDVGDRLGELEKYRASSSTILRNHETLIESHETEIKTLRSELDKAQKENSVMRKQLASLQQSFDEQMKAIREDFKKRLAEAQDTFKEMPELVERLVDATNKVVDVLPEDVRTNVQKLDLKPIEKKTLEVVKQRAATGKVKLPKHAR